MSAGVSGFSKYNCIEGIQNRAIHVFLGVHKFAPKLGLEGDMGWMDFYLAQSGHINCYLLNLESSFYERKQIDIEMIKENLMNIQEENWLHSVSNKLKLGTFKLFKETLRVENYVHL